MIFENPGFLWLLLALPPLLFGLCFWGWRAKKDAVALPTLVLRRLRRKQVEKYIIAGVLLVLLIVVLALPKVSYYATSATEKTGEIVLLVDVTRSMAAQKDLDSPSMLERTKLILYEIVSRMEELRQAKIALFGLTNIARSHVPFVGIEGYPYLKVTIKQVLNINSTPGGDTGFGRPIQEVAAKFSEGEQPKLIILISDGELFYWNLPRVTDDERKLIEQAVTTTTERDIKVITVGVGEPGGAKIPLYAEGEFTGYVQADVGVDFVFHLKEDILKEIAFRTGGEYFTENDIHGLTEYIADNLTPVESEIDEDVKVYTSIANWFLLASLPIWVVFVRRHLLG
jgi:hypothetical protein